MSTPFSIRPELAGWPPEELAALRAQIAAEAGLYAPPATAGQVDQAGQHQAGQDEQRERPRVLTVDEYLAEIFPPVEPLIGTPAAALLVRGEGVFFAAHGGTGKTAVVTDAAFKLGLGLSVLGYPVARPLRACIWQAEIPGTYYQQRVRQLSEAYSLADEDQAAEARTRIHVPLFRKVPDLGTEDGLKVLLEMQQEAAADMLIIDPYLSFFPNVPENDNGAVRAALDRLKFTVLLPGNCGAVITDHMAKPPAGQKGSEGAQEGGNDPRGAGAKRDWCCTLASMRRTKTPDGEHGDFLKLVLDKVRYGPTPRDPLTLHRDPFSGRFELWHRHSVTPDRVAELVSETDGGQSKVQLVAMVAQELTLSHHDARALIDRAVSENLLTVEPGPKKALCHYVGPAYTPHRGTCSTCSETRSSCSAATCSPEFMPATNR